MVQVRLDNRVLKVVENRVVSSVSKELLIETLQVGQHACLSGLYRQMYLRFDFVIFGFIVFCILFKADLPGESWLVALVDHVTLSIKDTTCLSAIPDSRQHTKAIVLAALKLEELHSRTRCA